VELSELLLIISEMKGIIKLYRGQLKVLKSR